MLQRSSNADLNFMKNEAVNLEGSQEFNDCKCSNSTIFNCQLFLYLPNQKL